MIETSQPDPKIWPRWRDIPHFVLPFPRWHIHPHNVDSMIDPEVKVWLRANACDRWQVTGGRYSRKGIRIRFVNENDAFAFAMRWA